MTTDTEAAFAAETEVVGVQVIEHEDCRWRVHSKVEKWETDEAFARGDAPYEVVEDHGNLLLNAGITRMLDKLIGSAGQVYDSAHCRLGVGNSSTAAAASQTDLQASAGAGNRQFKLCTSVSVSGQVLTVVASFGSSEANFQWNEWGIDQGTADGTTVVATMLNRRVPGTNLGTKTTGTWQLTVTITIS